MQPASQITRKTVFTSRNGVVRIIRRRLATGTPSGQAIPRKKKSVVRKVFWAGVGLTGAFYVGSPFVAFNNQTYYDIFSERVPLGQSMLEYAEAHSWDALTLQKVIEATKNAAQTTRKLVTDTLNGTKTTSPEPEPTAKRKIEKKIEEVKPVIKNIAEETKTKVVKVAGQVTQQAEKSVHDVVALVNSKTSPHASEPPLIAGEIAELVRKAEDAVKKPIIVPETPPTATSASVPLEGSKDGQAAKHVSKNVYTGPLPIGFEPPPGYQLPAPQKEPISAGSVPATLPLLAPAVSSLDASEPIITHLAGTIDNLVSYLASNPAVTSEISDVLEIAKSDLTSLVHRIEKAREEERLALETRLDEQTREYTVRLMDLEMEAQDRLDHQHEDFRKLFDEEKIRLAHTFREKLERELRTQTEIITERLKEEVIAQGIELQRRWIREIKVRVEQERGGRLGKLAELSSHLKRLERVALDNSSYLDESIRLHNLWSALRAVTFSSLSSSVRKPFRDELRVLRHISDVREDPVIAAALESLESSEVPDIGVEPFADLSTWFSNDVAPKVSQVALVPEENAGVLSYLASSLFSRLQFKRNGLVAGSDVMSVLSRAEYYLNEKDLDSAARELNQLRGPAKLLLHDWLEAARRRLEVEQALDVVQTQATLASLLVV